MDTPLMLSINEVWETSLQFALIKETALLLKIMRDPHIIAHERMNGSEYYKKRKKLIFSLVHFICFQHLIQGTARE